jgi:hypothetical protein
MTESSNAQAEEVKLPQKKTTSIDEEEESSRHYRYIKFDQVETIFFPHDKPLPAETLCWVLLSKGKEKGPQLSMRARIVEPCEDGRMLVRYPLGSTYRVRREMLLPVLEHEEKLVIVAPETSEYRRTAVVHTRQDDHFIEIGCDYGILVDSVDALSSLGIDKSEESIAIANERYPSGKYMLADIFDEAFQLEVENPLVVAIDINGNRELPAVIDCLQIVLDKMSPRIVVVKSRELYSELSTSR